MEKGDFLYQSDQELFLVLIDESDHAYRFAIHGWREIDKDRLDYYLSDEGGSIYTSDEARRTVEKHGNDTQKQQFNELLSFFKSYADADIDEDGVHTTYSYDDTPPE